MSINAYIVYIISLGLGHSEYSVREQTSTYAVTLNNIFDLRKELNKLAENADDVEVRVRARNIGKEYDILFPFPFKVPPIYCLDGKNDNKWCQIFWTHFYTFYVNSSTNTQFGEIFYEQDKIFLTWSSIEDLRVQTYSYIRNKNLPRYQRLLLVTRMKYNEVLGRFYSPVTYLNIVRYRLNVR
jgi:hypothetical protein